MTDLKIKNFLLFLLPLLFNTRAVSQSNDAITSVSPFYAAEILKNGTLIVRLSTGSSKIKALEKLIASPNVADKDRRRYQVMLYNSSLEIKNQNFGLVEAFRDNYRFSKLLFMPDTAFLQLKNGVKRGIFLDDFLKIDSTISLQGDYLIAYYGKSNLPEYTNNEGINVVDPSLEPMKSPFPGFIGVTSIRRTFSEIFNSTTDKFFYTILVTRFQKRLEEL